MLQVGDIVDNKVKLIVKDIISLIENMRTIKTYEISYKRTTKRK